jgi:hypothetical protein
MRYPVLLNSNGQIQDSDGDILLTIFNFFVLPGRRELGEELVQMINENEVKPEPTFSPIDPYAPIVSPIQSWEDGEKLKAEAMAEVAAVPLEAPEVGNLITHSAFGPPHPDFPLEAPLKKKMGNPNFKKGQKNPYAKKKA